VCVCKVVCVCFRLHSVQRRASSQRRAGTACHRPVRQVARLRRDSSRTVPSPNEGSCSLAVFSHLLCHTQFTESVLCHSLCHTQFTQSLLCHSLCHTQSTECLLCENLRTVCRRCTVKPPEVDKPLKWISFVWPHVDTKMVAHTRLPSVGFRS